MKGLVRLSGFSVGLKVVRFVLGMGSSLLLTRLMPIHEYGVYAYTLVIAALLAIPGEAGMPNLVMREIPRARVDGDVQRIRGIIIFANTTVFVLTLTMAIIGGLALWLLHDRIPLEFRYTLAAVFPALLLGSLANTRAGVQRALGSPIVSQLPEQFVRPTAIIIFAIIAWLIVRGPINALEGIIGFVLASGTAFVFGAVLLYRVLKVKVGRGPATFRTRHWLGALAPFSAIAGLQVALVQAAAFILGLYASPSEVAVFRIATLASDFTLFSTFAINALVAPQFAEYHHRGEMGELQALVARVNGLNVTFALTVFLGLVIVGPWALHFGFGKAYVAAYVPMCILSIGHLFGAAMGYVTTLANMSGRERMTMVAAIFGFTTNTVLSLLLCPRYGALGAAIAASMTAVVWRLALSIRLFQILSIRAWAIDWNFSRIIAESSASRLSRLITPYRKGS